MGFLNVTNLPILSIKDDVKISKSKTIMHSPLPIKNTNT